MKLWAIARFEFDYQARRAWPWLIAAALGVFAFLMARDGSLAEALRDDFFVNSPFAVAKTTVLGSLIWLLVAAVIAGEAAARDVATGMHALTYTMPLGKAAYLGGRFLAALALNALILLAVQAGILLAVYLPGVDPALIGPFRPAAFLTAYGFLALPNALTATALQFALATRTGRPMASYLASLLLFFMAYVVSTFLLFQGRRDLTSLLDPIGVHFILSDLSLMWTPTEKRARLLELAGDVLLNRLLWLGVGLGALAAAYLSFRFAQRPERVRWRPLARRQAARAAPPEGVGVVASVPMEVPQVRGAFGLAADLRRTLAIGWTSSRALATSWAGLATLTAIPLLAIPVVIDQMELNGVPMLPTTARVIGELSAPLSAELSRWVIIPLLIVYFAGELYWRERDAGLGEIVDALPGSEWAPLLGKFLGLGLVLALLMALLTAAGVLAQLLMGYQEFELGLYLQIMFGLQLPEYLLFALLALVIHVLVNQKYLGHLAALGAYLAIPLASLLGVEHDLLIYSASPDWSYTEMSGFGPSLGPWLWFKLYWAAWALLLAVVARLLWVRGGWGSLAVRLRTARLRLSRATATIAALAVGLILSLGGFIFFNTNLLNEYRTAADRAERGAEYERRYGRYRDLPQPQLTSSSLLVEIYPERQAVEIRGTYQLVNRGAAAIDSLHLASAPEVETGAVTFDRPAAVVLADEELGHRIYALERPLQPGDALQLDFVVQYRPRGFPESGADNSVVANGTFFTSGWLPAVGYQQSRELTGAGDRREHGLAPRPLIPSLYDVEARQGPVAGVAFEAVVGTAAGQIAVAPGALRRTWTEGARQYFHYATDAPIGSEHYFFSARYGVHEARWNDVAIRILHHPRHTANLERMVRSIRASLDYYSEQFGPYPYRHLTLVEYPGDGDGAGIHAEPGMLIYEEGFSRWNPRGEPGSLDLPYAVMAHEVAHQWTVPYAFVEGAPVLSESVAWYYALKVVERERGPEELRRLLSFMRQPFPYPPIRRGEPLLQGLDPYLAYRKGPFALYTLSEYLGEERVNSALRRLVAAHRTQGAPLATTLDLYRELQAVTPDALQGLLHDLFEVNTYWELETERATAVEAEDGSWRVTLDVRARKVVVDEAGVESEAPLDELVQIGVFGAAQTGETLGAPLYVEMHRISAGEQQITVTVPREPALAAIDPHNLLDGGQGEQDDTLKEVERER